MGSPELENIWMDSSEEGVFAIRLDWDNDRHHAIEIRRPCEKTEVAEALHKMALLIESDMLLK